jgi:hypothetical protein
MTPISESEERLRWQGAESVDAIVARLERTGRVVIELPADYNHAIHALLHEGESPVDAEEIDKSGGTDLLERLAGVHGLEELSMLAGALIGDNISVQVQSPPTIILETSA